MRIRFKQLIRPATEVTIGLMIGGPLLGVAKIIAWMFPYPYRDARSNAEFQADLANYVAEAPEHHSNRRVART
jgi:hypothetical protein